MTDTTGQTPNITPTPVKWYDLPYLWAWEKKIGKSYMEMTMEEIIQAVGINPQAISKKTLIAYIEAMEANYINTIKGFVWQSYPLQYTKEDTAQHLARMTELNTRWMKALSSAERNELMECKNTIETNAKETQKQIMELDQQIYNIPFYEKIILALKTLLPWLDNTTESNSK